MLAGFVTRSLARAAGHVPGVRRVPVLKLLSIAEVAILARDHLARLTPAERRRLVVLVRAGRGRPSNLRTAEREELHELVAKLEPRLLAGAAVDRLSPVPLPHRLVHGRGRPR
jgi:hypothetical protein